jgi:predicted GH43/DUF377 family glycosyl hydrolase
MFTVRRSSSNPFVRPENGTPWEAIAAFNPSPVEVRGQKYVLYRAASSPDLYKGRWLSPQTMILGLAPSTVS